MAEVLYLCDEKRCENCTAPGLCRYTTDISHAKNFAYDGVAEVWYEVPNCGEKNEASNN